jgi:copper chaperone CopZ
MISTFLISNTTCLSCNNEVLKSIGSLQGVFGAEIDRFEGKVLVSHTDEVNRQKIIDLLNGLGLSILTT